MPSGGKITHGMSNTTEFRIWANMLTRCTNKKFTHYKHYGARGIKPCKRWLKFENFFEDMGNRPSLKHSLDRIDNNKGYFKENCRWALKKTQARNHRANVIIELNGVSKTIIEWAEYLNITPSTLYGRCRKGYTPEDVLYKGSFNSQKRKT